MATNLELLQILEIGHAMSMRGEGISLRSAMRRARYSELRASFEPSDLVPLIESDPSLLEKWLAYCGDKRATGGWYVTEEAELGRVLRPEFRVQFASLTEAVAAVAHYVVRELDFWASVDKTAERAADSDTGTGRDRFD